MFLMKAMQFVNLAEGQRFIQSWSALHCSFFVTHLSRQTCTHNLCGWNCWSHVIFLYHYLCSIFLTVFINTFSVTVTQFTNGNHKPFILSRSCTRANTHKPSQISNGYSQNAIDCRVLIICLAIWYNIMPPFQTYFNTWFTYLYYCAKSLIPCPRCWRADWNDKE